DGIEARLDALPPHAARSWLATLRSLCQFAMKQKWLRADPTANIKLAPIGGDGFHTWTDDEIEQFEAHHPIGSKPRLALALLFYTAQRRGDVVRMGRQHIRETPDGPVLYVNQLMIGKEFLTPIYPELRAVLDALPIEHLTFLVASPTVTTISASVFANGAMRPDCRSVAPRTGRAKRDAVGSPSTNAPA